MSACQRVTKCLFVLVASEITTSVVFVPKYCCCFIRCVCVHAVCDPSKVLQCSSAYVVHHLSVHRLDSQCTMFCV